MLWTARYLYSNDSDIIKALVLPGHDIVLSTLNLEHRKFLADISLQISDTDTKLLYEMLDRPGRNDSDAFVILGNWVDCPVNSVITLAQLKERLKRMNIVNISVCGNKNQNPLLSSHLEQISVMDYWDDSPKLRLDLPQKLQSSWMNVGRLLGISANNLDTVHKQKLELVYEWQRTEGKGATFGALFKAIHRVCELDSILIKDAHFFCEQYVRTLTHVETPNV